MKKFTRVFTVSVLFLLLIYPLSVGANPSLGVAPGVDEWGVYNGPEENYLKYFADEFVNWGGNPGFILPESGGSLAVWYGSDNGTLDLSVDIYLATNSAAGDDFTFFGMNFTSINDTGNQADGYQDHVFTDNGVTYYGVNLGSIQDDLDDGELDNWTILSDSYWPGTWYFYTGIIEYSDFQPYQEDWMFAIADRGEDGLIFENGKDDFSPKTTSSNSVPEPSTMLLFGTGFLGLAMIGRKKLFKK